MTMRKSWTGFQNKS